MAGSVRICDNLYDYVDTSTQVICSILLQSLTIVVKLCWPDFVPKRRQENFGGSGEHDQDWTMFDDEVRAKVRVRLVALALLVERGIGSQ